jgi:hypothetical protein
MTEQEMRKLLESTLDLQRKIAAFKTRPRTPAHLMNGVTPEHLAELSRHVARLGARIPPSFETCLRISDGIPDYLQLCNLSLRSAKEIVDLRAQDEGWNHFAPLHEFVISSGRTDDLLAFDHTRRDPAGEMLLVWVDGRGDRTEFETFEKLLLWNQDFQQSSLAAEQADRSHLDQD